MVKEENLNSISERFKELPKKWDGKIKRGKSKYELDRIKRKAPSRLSVDNFMTINL